jgi:hypothetical protein
MTCRCRDTGCKRCKWEHRTDSWTKHLKLQVKLDRKRVNQQLRSTRPITPTE